MGWLSLVAGGASILGNAVQERKNFETSDAAAQGVLDQAKQEAVKVRRYGSRVEGQARGGLAASGVNVDSGSAALDTQEIKQNTEADAFNTILSGQRQATSIRAGNAAEASALQTRSISSGLSALGDYYSKYGGQTQTKWRTSSGVGA